MNLQSSFYDHFGLLGWLFDRPSSPLYGNTLNAFIGPLQARLRSIRLLLVLGGPGNDAALSAL